MSHRKLHKPQALQRPENCHWDARTDALDRWSALPNAAVADDPNTITIFDYIGEDIWTGGGFTTKRMAAALRHIGDNDVTVKINSPGGNVFEGIAIYNLLREHPAKVTISVVGLAASAASIIAMAGDTISMGLGTFLMVHNAWGVVIGNQNDLREAADTFQSLDAALVDIYAARTGMPRKDIDKLMDAETFMGPSEAIEKGFADEIDEGVSVDQEANNSMPKEEMPRRRMEAALARAGFSRKERGGMITSLLDAQPAERDASRSPSARDAGRPAERDAGDLSSLSASLRDLKATINSK